MNIKMRTLSAIAIKSMYIRSREKAFASGLISEEDLIRDYKWIISVRGPVKSVAHKVAHKPALSIDDEGIVI